MSFIKNLRYHIGTVWDGESGAEVNLREGYALKLDMPAAFGGLGRHPCPNELFFSAIGSCLLMMFLYFEKRFNLHLQGLRVLVDGNVEMIGPEGYRITGIRITVHIETIKSDRGKAEKCAELMMEYCPITRTLEKVIPIEVSVKIQTP